MFKATFVMFLFATKATFVMFLRKYSDFCLYMSLFVYIFALR
jgi:hypothetical protein